MKIMSSSAKAVFAAMLLVPALLFASGKEGGSRRGTATKSAPAHANGLGSAAASKGQPKIAEAFAKLPLSFEKNLGQADSSVRYLAHGQGYQLFLTPQEAVLSLRRSTPILASPRDRVAYRNALREAQQSAEISVLRFQFEGAIRPAEIDGVDLLPGRTDYFVGNDPKGWHTGVPNYGRVQYRGIYPGVDLIFYGNQRRLEYDFVVAPGADPGAISLNVEGARNLTVDSHGNLLLNLPVGEVQLDKPVVYQEVNGERREVAGNYAISGNHKVTFAVSGYDATKQLIIDPVLNYSTYLGGSATGDIGYGIAVDASGDAYITGQTFNTSFPTTSSPATIGGYSTTADAGVGTNGAVFVSEIDPTGTKELYFTYLSGSGAGNGGEIGSAIALDPAPSASCPNALSAPAICVYVTGTTFSTNFPTTSSNALNAGPLGSNSLGISFVSKLNPAVSGTNSLLYSSYVGGTGGEFGWGIAVDAAANAYVVGFTDSTDFPQPTVPNGYQTSRTSVNGDAFLARIDTTKSGAASLIYSTYLGGDGANSGAAATFQGDQANAVAVDSSGKAYLTGVTSSTNFPTTASAFQSTLPAGNTNDAAFVAVLDTTKSGTNSLFYSTYLGGSSAEIGNGIALGPANVAYVTGETLSSNFPFFPAGAYPAVTLSGHSVAFLTLVDPSQIGSTSLKYSTVIGGSNGDVGYGIAVDALGNAYVTGGTQSSDFPIVNGALKPSLGSAPGDAFIFELSPLGTGSADLVYSSYFGGDGNGSPDQARAIALDSAKNAYLTGLTFSSASSFPVFPNTAFQTTLTGTSAAFVAKLTLEPTMAVSPASLSFTGQVVGIASTAQTVTLTNNTNVTVNLSASSVTAGSPPASAADFAATNGTCAATLAAGASCTVSVTFTASVAGTETATLNLNNSDSSSPQTVGLSGTSVANAPVVLLTPLTQLTFASQVVGTTSSPQTVTVKNTGPATLHFTGAPAITGTGGTPNTDFAIASGSGTTCTNGSTVAANQTCTIAITFTPSGTTPNPRTGTLTLTDDATPSGTLSLSGTATAVTPPAATPTPASLTFTGQLVTTTSTAQTVTVRNTGGSSLTFGASAIGISGDFAQTNTCNSATLASNATCTISVTFTPTTAATNPRTGNLTITPSNATAPTPVTLSGTGQDYTVTATSPAAINRGSTASIPVTVIGLGGYTGSVSFTCTGSIPGGSCVAPSAVNAAPAPGATATFMVTTTAFIAPPPSRQTPPVSPRQVFLLLAALLLLFTVPAARQIRTRLSLAGATMLLIVLAGCAGTPVTSTPSGPYTFNITATSGTVSHAVNVTVTVN